mmetsp:Transcript_14172/g.20775  ORF Transcript_14172/g.20775 Transcript_14172/m.20775 type:complete len:177 (-) Transcript_14172:576-1106(-)
MLFSPYGELVRIDMKKNYAFVQFTNVDDATKAKEATNGGKLDQSVITVEYVAQRRRDRDERGGRGGGDRDRGGYRGGGRSDYRHRRDDRDRDDDRRRSPPRYRDDDRNHGYRGRARSRSRSPGYRPRSRSRSPRRDRDDYRGRGGYRNDRNNDRNDRDYRDGGRDGGRDHDARGYR